MERWAEDDGVQALFEIFAASQRWMLKSLDYQGMRLTKYQIYLLIILARKESMTMSQAAASLGCSKEQATRLVAALVDAGYLERLHSKENRKLVMIRLTEEGSKVICWERTVVREKLRKGLSCLEPKEMEAFFHAIGQLLPLLHKLEEYQEKKIKEFEHEIYRKYTDGAPAGGFAEAEVVRRLSGDGTGNSETFS